MRVLLALAVTALLAGCGSSSNAPVIVPPVPAPTGHLTLTWAPPRKNTDGTPLTLAGFRIYHDGLTVICGPAVTTYITPTLTKGKHSFVVTAIGADGAESNSTCAGSGVVK